MRWTPDGKATLLPALPGHTWTNAFGINDDGVVSGWSRKLPNDDGEKNPVIWDASGKVIPLKTAPGRADGIAEATNRSGLTVGYLGNLGTDGIPGVANTDPERDNAVVWQSRTAEPRLLGPPCSRPLHRRARRRQRPRPGRRHVRQPHEQRLRAGRAADLADRLDGPEADPNPGGVARRAPVVVTQLNDINNRGDIVGNVYGLAARTTGAASHRPRPLDVPVRPVTSTPA